MTQADKRSRSGDGKVEVFGSTRDEALLGEYRLYFLDSIRAGRLISESLEFEAASDGAAFNIAERVREGRPVELWRGTRKLKVWPRKSSKEPHIG